MNSKGELIMEFELLEKNYKYLSSIEMTYLNNHDFTGTNNIAYFIANHFAKFNMEIESDFIFVDLSEDPQNQHIIAITKESIYDFIYNEQGIEKLKLKIFNNKISDLSLQYESLSSVNDNCDDIKTYPKIPSFKINLKDGVSFDIPLNKNKVSVEPITLYKKFISDL